MFQKTDKGGHKSVRLCKNRVHIFRGVHCLMLEAFVGPCPAGMQGAHNDGKPHRNILSNLRWDTPLGNAADKYRHGTIQFGAKNPLAKLTSSQVRKIRRMRKRKATYKEIGAQFDVTAANICSIIKGHTWSHL